MSGHEMTGPEFDGNVTTISCTCEGWVRRWRTPFSPNLTEAESDHEAHRQHAGARDLREGVIPRPNLDNLIAMTTALADLAKAGAAAGEALREFAEAHAAARQAGHGVLVVRRPDGTITSTANVFLSAGSAVFMDEPGPVTIPPIRFTPEPSRDPHAVDYIPRHTITTDVA